MKNLPSISSLAEAKKLTRDSGLRYTLDDEPGIRRKSMRGGSFVYVKANGKTVKDARVLERIRKLVIPPAWDDVWICEIANGHLQATGHDARNRKQYRYHAHWRAKRDENKFHRMVAFALALPRIRRRVRQDMKGGALTRETVLASIVRLLETTLIRVGNDEYARTNHSYGLTTFKNQHVRVQGTSIEFAFRGKSGKQHQISLHDRALARIVRRCHDMPGQKLFTYSDADGKIHTISSHDVNTYLQEISGDDFTAKDFRTWEATVLAARALKAFDAPPTSSDSAKNVVIAVKAVAESLGNTPAVCRKSYIHPFIIASFERGVTISNFTQNVSQAKGLPAQLRADENAVLSLLRKQQRKDNRTAGG